MEDALAGAWAGAWAYSIAVMVLVVILAWRRDEEFRAMSLAERVGASVLMILAAPMTLPILLISLASDTESAS